MKKKRNLLLLSVLMLAGCSTLCSRTDTQKDFLSAKQRVQDIHILTDCRAGTEDSSYVKGVEDIGVSKDSLKESFEAPYAQYTLKSGDTEIWFYEDFYVVFAGNKSFLKEYDGAIVDKTSE